MSEKTSHMGNTQDGPGMAPESDNADDLYLQLEYEYDAMNQAQELEESERIDREAEGAE